MREVWYSGVKWRTPMSVAYQFVQSKNPYGKEWKEQAREGGRQGNEEPSKGGERERGQGDTYGECNHLPCRPSQFRSLYPESSTL